MIISTLSQNCAVFTLYHAHQHAGNRLGKTEERIE